MALIMPITQPENGLLYSANNVKLKIDNKVVGQGTIYIAQDTLSWQPVDMPNGISIEWKQVSLHGIASNPVKCVYFILDHKVCWEGVTDVVEPAINGQNGVAARPEPDGNGDVDEGNGSDEDIEEFEDAIDDEVTECWLLPDDVHSVDTIYRAMTACQALHPDSADSDSDDSDYGAAAMGMVYVDQAMEEDASALGRNGGEVGGMQNLNLDDDDDKRFEDAEE